MDAQTGSTWKNILTLRNLIMIGVAIFVVLAALAWYALRPPAAVNSFGDCAKAGYPVQESYPEVCRAPDGRTFTNPDQKVEPPPGASDPRTSLSFNTLVSGDSGGQSDAQSAVIKQPGQWQRFWGEIHAHITPTPPLLEVNFKQDMVVAALMGQRPSGGHSIKITSITETASGLVVQIRETLPGAGCGTTQALTSPYHLVTTKLSDKPVEFKTDQVKRDCPK